MADLWDSFTNVFSESIEDASQEWDNAVEKLKAKAQEFVQVENRLKELEPIVAKNPELKDSYNKLMNRGQWIKESITTVTNMIDKAANTLDGVGLNKLHGMQMGILPLIPIAVITGAVAGASAWIADGYVEIRRIELADKLAKTPEQAATILGAGKNGSTFFDSGSIVQSAGLYLLIGIGIYTAWPKIKGFFK